MAEIAAPSLVLEAQLPPHGIWVLVPAAPDELRDCLEGFCPGAYSEVRHDYQLGPDGICWQCGRRWRVRSAE